MSGVPGEASRRRFFAQGLEWLLRPAASYLEQNLAPPVSCPRLRPPGALPEAEFVDTCYRCGTCVEVCPANAIVAVHAPDEPAHGTPMIDPDLAACAICDELVCMRRCPSGALRLVDDRRLIRMGLAVVAPELCIRSTGEACARCVEVCPLGPDAIRIDGPAPPEVVAADCTGCGQCQHHCPTVPKAVVVKPR